MGTGVVVKDHADTATVLEAYRAERDGVRRAHLQVIWLLLCGETCPEVARVTGFSQRWVELLIHRWNAEGLEGLGDRRRRNAGKKPLLDEGDLAALAEVLEQPPPDGGLWSGPKVAAWMSERLGRPVSPKRGIEYLHRAGFSLQRPRPRHAKAASPEEQAAFKKNSPKRWMRHDARSPVGRSKSGRSTNTVSD